MLLQIVDAFKRCNASEIASGRTKVELVDQVPSSTATFNSKLPKSRGNFAVR